MEDEYDEFIGTVRDDGNKGKIITFPKKNAIFSDIKVGDQLKIKYKKKKEE